MAVEVALEAEVSQLVTKMSPATTVSAIALVLACLCAVALSAAPFSSLDPVKDLGLPSIPRCAAQSCSSGLGTLWPRKGGMDC